LADSDKTAQDDERNQQKVEALTRQLADQLRSMGNRQEMTDFAVSMLRESAEEAGQVELAQETARRGAKKRDPFNPIAFGIPLLVIGAVLCGTGILIGPGLAVIGIAAAMVVYGLVVAVLFRAKSDKADASEADGDSR
jgi:fatty acid desaturase